MDRWGALLGGWSRWGGARLPRYEFLYVVLVRRNYRMVDLPIRCHDGRFSRCLFVDTPFHYFPETMHQCRSAPVLVRSTKNVEWLLCNPLCEEQESSCASTFQFSCATGISTPGAICSGFPRRREFALLKISETPCSVSKLHALSTAKRSSRHRKTPESVNSKQICCR